MTLWSGAIKKNKKIIEEQTFPALNFGLDLTELFLSERSADFTAVKKKKNTESELVSIVSLIQNNTKIYSLSGSL